jgi:hypothetical protein
LKTVILAQAASSRMRSDSLPLDEAQKRAPGFS